jgi:hypothetical protein
MTPSAGRAEMGWTCQDIPSGPVNRRVFCREAYTWSPDSVIKGEILAEGMVGSTWYAAIRTTNKETGVSQVWGAICLTNVSVVDGHRQICIKELEEDMGQVEDRCPVRILDLLDRLAPDPGANALEWRAKCRAYHAKQRKAIRPGDWIKFEQFITFSNGDIEHEFIFVPQGRRVRFVGLNTGRTYRISGWRQRNFTVERFAS